MKKPRKIRYIVVHHSLTKDGPQLSWPAIRRYHVEKRGWDRIGYNAGLEMYHGHYEVLIGRPWTMVGAHAPGRNKDSLGVCFVGDFDADPPRRDNWVAAVDLVAWLAIQFRVPVRKILGHREVTKNRTCPGRWFDLDKFRADVAKRLG